LKLVDVSVIVCTHNHEKWIERCVRSLDNQILLDKNNFEVIIVNDSSKDNTKKILKNLKKLSYLKIINNDKNIGLSKSINKAIKISTGRYIVRVDSDDYVARNFIYLLKLYLDKNKEYQAVASDYYRVSSDEKIIDKNNCFKNEIACGIMFRKETLIGIGMYNETFSMREGHELKKRFTKKYKLGRVEFPIYKYRQHDDNRTRTKKKMLKIFDKKLKKK
jgi:glycosyltransferase involved in cell wall biosynthesis